MSPIPDDLIEQVRDAADIVGLIGQHVELKRTGSDYRGPCPFHGGTHRNFAVIPKKGLFYCFVCHEAGDVFTFYMKRFGLDYPSAVRQVAAQVGIAIPERSSAGPDPQEPLYQALSVAAQWYARRLGEAPDAQEARAYLEGRGFALEELLPWGLGWAPAGEEFVAAMQQLGLDQERLLEAGLLFRREDGSLHPRFRQRLLFPIHDLRGRVVGFGGRLLGGGEPKYLNSPESPVFRKGRLLYHLHHAKQAIRQAAHAVVVEGYFDVLRLVQVGVENVVAPLGTGLSPEQAALLKRFTSQVVLLYDGDAPGLKASFRAADELLRAGLRVELASLPPGEDPDTLARRGGAEAVRRAIDQALDVLERKLQVLEQRGWLASVSGRRRALDRLLPTLRAAADPVTRDLYLSRAAEALGVSRAAIETEWAVGREPLAPRVPRQAEPPQAAAPPLAAPERELLKVMAHQPDWRARIAEQLPDRSLLEASAREVFEALAGAGTAPAAELLDQLAGQARAVLAQILAEPWGGWEVDRVVEDAMNRLDSRRLEQQLSEIERSLPFAADADKAELMRQVERLSRQIKQLNPGRWNVMRTGGSGAR